jgi:hypothetical protein
MIVTSVMMMMMMPIPGLEREGGMPNGRGGEGGVLHTVL